MHLTRRLGTFGALVATSAAVTLAATAVPAHADPYGPDEATSVSVVTRLTLDHGTGFLVVQPRLRSGGYTGFEVQVPAGDGVWSAAPVVSVPELAIVCREDAGHDLHYRCGQTQGAFTGSYLPIGGYQISFRVAHSGDPEGLTGTSSLDAIVARGDDFTEYVGPLRPDVFPVHTTPHTRSTAEVGVAPLTSSPGSSQPGATVATTLTVVPGETATALDVTLPRTRWRITGSNAARLGLQCFVRTDGPSLHCRPAVGRASFPAGRYGLTVNLTYEPRDDDRDPAYAANSILTLTVDGDPEASYDDFPWRAPQVY